MKLSQIVVGAALVASAAGVAQAQNYAYNTQGCFGNNCTLANTAFTGPSSDHLMDFARNAGATGTLASLMGSGVSVNLGTLTYRDEDINNVPFKLGVNFTAPVGAGSQVFAAAVDGEVKFGCVLIIFCSESGVANVDFDNTEKEFAFSGGSLFLKVNDIGFDDRNSTKNITGQLRYVPVTTTPEPSSMALLGTGLVGLVPMIRRRRK